MNEKDLLLKAEKPSKDAMRLHPYYKGKIQMMPKCPVNSIDDFSIWYSPGVAAPCRDIQANPEKVWEHTNRGNSIAIISNGTRVLGLGNIGPEASMPVMEGKALIYKYLGGVDAVPLVLRTEDPDEFIKTVKILEPSFGGINLEDISSPECFYILDTLRKEMNIPVWHDDQQGTATVILAGLINALKIVGKAIGNVQITMIGMGAANVATFRLLKAFGANIERIVVCDSKGILHKERSDIEEKQKSFPDKWYICKNTNKADLRGSLKEAISGADVLISCSRPGPGVIKPEWIQSMEKDAI